MTDLSHLDALTVGLLHEQARLAAAAHPREIAMRTVWVAQIKREIAREMDFLGGKVLAEISAMSDDELLAALAEG